MPSECLEGQHEWERCKCTRCGKIDDRLTREAFDKHQWKVLLGATSSLNLVKCQICGVEYGVDVLQSLRGTERAEPSKPNSCHVCHGTRMMTCLHCQGSGQKSYTASGLVGTTTMSGSCGVCRGTGRVRCNACK